MPRAIVYLECVMAFAAFGTTYLPNTRGFTMTVTQLIRCVMTPVLLVSAAMAHAQVNPLWTEPQKPFQIYGNSYYVGTKGLGSVLITSKKVTS